MSQAESSTALPHPHYSLEDLQVKQAHGFDLYLKAQNVELCNFLEQQRINREQYRALQARQAEDFLEQAALVSNKRRWSVNRAVDESE